MRTFLIRRLIQSAILLFVLMTFSFALVRLTPGGPDAILLEQPNLEKADIERLRERLGLNDPLPVAYAKWVGNAIRLDFGRSYQYLRPPTEIVKDRLWPSLQLGAMSFLFGILGIPLGVWAALNRGRGPDIATRLLTLVGDALPHYWLAFVIILLMSSYLGWFPQGRGDGSFLSWLQHVSVPAMILGTGVLVSFTRYTRSQVLEVVGQDHVRTARAKGLVELAVTTRHILRNALLPVVTLFGGLLPYVVSGAALTEPIFRWPGMGSLYLEAAFTRDYPLLLCVLTLLTLATLTGTLVADLLYGWVDPRIKYS